MPSDSIECPVCGGSFSFSEIERHVSDCLDRKTCKIFDRTNGVKTELRSSPSACLNEVNIIAVSAGAGSTIQGVPVQSTEPHRGVGDTSVLESLLEATIALRSAQTLPTSRVIKNEPYYSDAKDFSMDDESHRPEHPTAFRFWWDESVLEEIVTHARSLRDVSTKDMGPCNSNKAEITQDVSVTNKHSDIPFTANAFATLPPACYDRTYQNNHFGMGRVVRINGCTVRSGVDIDQSSELMRLSFGDLVYFDTSRQLEPQFDDCVPVTRLRVVAVCAWATRGARADAGPCSSMGASSSSKEEPSTAWIDTHVRALPVPGWVSLHGRTIEDHEAIIEIVRPLRQL